MATNIEIVRTSRGIIEVVSRGMQGPANTLEVLSVTTLGPDDDATFEIEGISPHQGVRVGIPKGDTGSRGPAIELAIVGVDLCWRVSGTDGEWIVITPMSALVGETGDNIELRISGGSLQWRPTLAGTWIDLIAMSTLKGDTGDYAQMRRNGANVEWKPSSAPDWAILMPLTDIKGDKGETVQLRRDGANIEWKQADQVTWTQLVPLLDIKGDQGTPGAPGEPLLAVIGDQTDTGLGGWWITRDYHGVASCNYLRAEVLAGDVAGVTMRIMHNGVLHRGSIPLSSAGPTIITDLGLLLAKGDRVSVHRDSGIITGPWLIAVQIDGRA